MSTVVLDYTCLRCLSNALSLVLMNLQATLNSFLYLRSQLFKSRLVQSVNFCATLQDSLLYITAGVCWATMYRCGKI